MEKIYVNTKIKFLWWLWAELHFEEFLELVVGIVFVVGIHLAILSLGFINLAC